MECLKDVCGSEFARLATGQVLQKINQLGRFYEVSSNHRLPFGTSPKKSFCPRQVAGQILGIRLSIFPILHVANQSAGHGFQPSSEAVARCSGFWESKFRCKSCSRARIIATSSTRLTQTTHNTTSKKMACIASSFTGSVAALKATKIQVCIHSNRPRISRFPSHRRLPAFG